MPNYRRSRVKIEPISLRLIRYDNIDYCYINPDKQGRVIETTIIKGIPNTGLDEAAISAIRKTRFRPARQRERAVGVWISIPVNFKLKG